MENFNSLTQEKPVKDLEISQNKYNTAGDSPTRQNRTKFKDVPVKYHPVYEKEGRYDGEFEDDLKHGKGTFDYLDGRKYDGEWQHDKKHGFGIMYNKSGKVEYEGMWENNKKNGSGILVTNNGERYEGDFVEDMKHGVGKYEYVNGDIYEGDWVKNLRQGTGFFT